MQRETNSFIITANMVEIGLCTLDGGDEVRCLYDILGAIDPLFGALLRRTFASAFVDRFGRVSRHHKNKIKILGMCNCTKAKFTIVCT